MGGREEDPSTEIPAKSLSRYFSDAWEQNELRGIIDVYNAGVLQHSLSPAIFNKLKTHA